MVMYRSENWTVNKAEGQRTDAFKCGAGKDFSKSLGLQGYPKGNQPWIFIGRIVAETSAPILWPPDMKSQFIGKDPDAGKDWGQKRVSEDEMTGCHDQCNGHELGQTQGDDKEQGGLSCCSPWGHVESDRTGQLNNHRDVKTVSRCKKRS